MALADLPGIGTFQASKPVIAEPMDLQPAIEKMMGAYEEGFISAGDLQKRAIEGTSDAEAKRAENEARQAGAEQDVIDQRGAPASKKPLSGKTSATPQLDRALGGDIDFKNWTTPQLSQLAGEAGYSILGKLF